MKQEIIELKFSFSSILVCNGMHIIRELEEVLSNDFNIDQEFLVSEDISKIFNKKDLNKKSQ